MIKTFKLDEIESIASELLRNVNTNVLLFYGDMGVGKTTLIKAIVNELGYKQDVSSPTFSIVNEYEADDGLVYHFDLYRLNDETEAYDIGFEDYIDSGHWCLIEWPEKISKLLPENVDRIYLETDTDLNRIIKLNIKKVSKT